MTATTTLYRIQSPKGQSLWYDIDGNWDPVIMTLTEGISRNLPMEFDTRYHTDGKNWFCACENKDSFQQWFSALDVTELIQMGYELLKLEVAEFVIEPYQALFTKEGVLSQSTLKIGDLFT